MQAFAFILFALFALVLMGMYLAIRREWFAPGTTAGVGVVLSMLLMMFISLAQGNPFIWALILGIVLGGLFSAATLAIAWYFHKNELRTRYMNAQHQPRTE